MGRSYATPGGIRQIGQPDLNGITKYAIYCQIVQHVEKFVTDEEENGKSNGRS